MSKTTAKTTKSKAKPSPAKPSKKPLTISIHGDGISVDATLGGDGEGIKALLTALRGAPLMRPTEQGSSPAPQTSGEALQHYSDAMINIITAADTPELLNKLAAMLELGQQAVRERLAEVSAPAHGPPPMSETASPNGAAASA